MIKWRACRFLIGQPDRSTKVVATKKNIVATHGRQPSRCRPCPLSLVFSVLIVGATLFSTGDARAQREVQSANNNIVYNGEKMQSASERYRMGKVIRPVNATTSSFTYSQAEQAAQTSMSDQSSSSSSTIK